MAITQANMRYNSTIPIIALWQSKFIGNTHSKDVCLWFSMEDAINIMLCVIITHIKKHIIIACIQTSIPAYALGIEVIIFPGTII